MTQSRDDRRLDPLREYKLKISRIKTFIIDLLEALGEDPLKWSPYFKEIIELTLLLEGIRQKINSTIYEAALTALFYDLRSRGLFVLNINRLINVAKQKLDKRISRGRIIILLNYLKRIEKNKTQRNEVEKLLISLLYRLSSDASLIKRLIAHNINMEQYFQKLREISFLLIDKIFLNPGKSSLWGRSPHIIVALDLYIADKIISSQHGYRSILSAKILEKHLGISQFTILRQYKKLMGELIEEQKLKEYLQ